MDGAGCAWLILVLSANPTYLVLGYDQFAACPFGVSVVFWVLTGIEVDPEVGVLIIVEGNDLSLGIHGRCRGIIRW